MSYEGYFFNSFKFTLGHFSYSYGSINANYEKYISDRFLCMDNRGKASCEQ